MKTGKITAKLRDAVPVCLMVNGEEVKRYKNIELPDMLKEVEMTDFHFNVHMDGKITFEIHYEEGVLPEAFPEARTRVSRAAKAAVKPPPRTAQRLWPQNKSRIPFCSSICYNPKNKIGSCRGEAMKISKVVLSIITILSAVLGLTKVLAFDITNPNCCSD